ncbi:mercury transport protein [Mesorhizobium cantuariense]|uniref:Mercury transport protein n=1 Tax=Mesorhizobium cantuariense TaxID=1300275 RepID=A0ABV7MVB8_9HYPH
MNDSSLVPGDTVGVILAPICCAAPLLAATLPWAGLGVVLHHRRAKVTCSNTKILNEGMKP